MALKKSWAKIKIEMDAQNKDGKRVHLRNVTAYRSPTGVVGVYPNDVVEALGETDYWNKHDPEIKKINNLRIKPNILMSPAVF